MAHWSTIQNSIVTKLQTISSVKNVKKNWQRIIDPQAYDDAFTVASDTDATERRVHTWIVVYSGASPKTKGEDFTTYAINYKFEIHGFINFLQDEDSETILRNIVDEVLAAFIPYKSLGLNGNATTPVIDSNISVDSFDIEEFGPVLCSHVKLGLDATVFCGNITYT